METDEHTRFGNRARIWDAENQRLLVIRLREFLEKQHGRNAEALLTQFLGAPPTEKEVNVFAQVLACDDEHEYNELIEELANRLQNNHKELFPSMYMRFKKGQTDKDDSAWHFTMMRVNGLGVPVPSGPSDISSGQIIAMAGDYFGSPGWYKDFIRLFSEHDTDYDTARKLITNPIMTKERDAFERAYDALASDAVTDDTIKEMYEIEHRRYLPTDTLNGYAKNIAFARRLKNYKDLLEQNDAHFAPWNLRAYAIGHEQATHYAQLTFHCMRRAFQADYTPEEHVFSEELELIEQALSDSFDACKITEAEMVYISERYPELESDSQKHFMIMSQRFKSLAYTTDLYAQHYLTDAYAGGHLEHIGELRRLLPDRYGFLGSALVNSAHDESNRTGVNVHNPLQPNIDRDDVLIMPIEDYDAFGDGTADHKENRTNMEHMVEATSGSMGDLTTTMLTGEHPDSMNSFCFFPLMNHEKHQYEPLFVLKHYDDEDTPDDIFVRQNVGEIHVLAPSEYAAMRENPEAYGYEKLQTGWRGKLQVLKLNARLRLWFAPKIIESDEEAEARYTAEEARFKEIHDQEVEARIDRIQHRVSDMPVFTMAASSAVEAEPVMQAANRRALLVTGYAGKVLQDKINMVAARRHADEQQLHANGDPIRHSRVTVA